MNIALVGSGIGFDLSASKGGKRMAHRVNTKISDRSNEWLDKKSVEMSVSKSALINIAIEQYRTQTEVLDVLPQLMAELEKQGIKLTSLQS